ncbi:MAG: hypothetical protein ACRYFW_16710 [Janthinobacterium lividum]
MILSAVLMLQAVAAPPPRAAEDGTVVVTGRRPAAAEAALAACLKRGCPPREDIAAATALAVAQFRAGDYEKARDTAGHAAARNHRYAGELPVQVSDLLALHGALSALTGLPEVSRARTFDAVSALRRGLPADDEHIAMARLAVADEFLRQGMIAEALHLYDHVARQAAAAGQPTVRGRAMFQAAMLYASAARFDSAYRSEARKRIAAINATTDPALKSYRDATVALRGQIASMEGRDRDLKKVLADAEQIRSHEALLVYNPKIDLAEAGTGTAQDAVGFDTDHQWITVAFRIAPDGTVRDVTTQDAGPHASGAWTRAVLASFARRRYLPLDMPADAPGLARVERVSLVSDVVVSTRSRIRTHAGAPSVRFTDMTPTAAPAAPRQPPAS